MIDLHSHSRRLDGTLSPVGLVEKGVALGLEALAIADRETLSGYDEALPHARNAGVELVCGVELSTRPHVALRQGRPQSVHLLGYFLHRDEDAPFRSWLGSQQNARRERNYVLVERLYRLGTNITLSELEAIGGSLAGRPHFVRILLEKGYVQSRQEAFDRYLADDVQAAVEREEPGLIEGVVRINKGGGLASLAHPIRLEAHDSTFLRQFLSPLIEAGLKAIEVYHSNHASYQTQQFRTLACEFGLAETGGSDFHGENKAGVSLGSGRGELAVPYTLLDDLRRLQRSQPEIENEATLCKVL